MDVIGEGDSVVVLGNRPCRAAFQVTKVNAIDAKLYLFWFRSHILLCTVDVSDSRVEIFCFMFCLFLEELAIHSSYGSLRFQEASLQDSFVVLCI